ncbi:MAG: MFS transporter [Actinomycetota bacterium]
MQKSKDKVRLPRNVVVLSFVSFFQDAASELLYPILPLFIVSILGASPAVLGLIEGIAEGTASALKAVSGRLSDRFARKPLIFAGYSLSGLSKPLIGLATGWPLVLVARFMDRTGKGIRTSPRDALIVADTPAEIRGAAFGFHRAADSLGAVVGPLIGLGLYYALHVDADPKKRMSLLFFAAFIPAVVSVVLIARVREHRPSTGKSKAEPITDETFDPAFRRVVGFLFLFGVINFSDTFILLRAKTLGLTFVQVILAYVAYNITYTLLSYPAGKISDRVDRRFVFATGLAIFAVAYFGLGIVHTAGWVWLLLPLYGGYTALTDGVSKAWVADMLPSSKMGTGIGIYHAIYGAAVLIASLWAGAFWHGSGSLPLKVSGGVAAGLAVALVVFAKTFTRRGQVGSP